MFGRRARLVLGLACLPLLWVGLAPGCGQGEGDRCEIDSDCRGGLLCDLSQGRSEGQCRAQLGTRPPDAAPDRPGSPAPDGSADRPATDASPDGASDGAGADRPDGAASDTAPGDAGSADGVSPG